MIQIIIHSVWKTLVYYVVYYIVSYIVNIIRYFIENKFSNRIYYDNDDFNTTVNSTDNIKRNIDIYVNGEIWVNGKRYK